MVIFNNWNLSETGGVLAHQYDNKTRALLVAGDLPDGWTWDMLVSVGDNLDIIRLSPMEGGVGVVLTAEMLSMTGYYVMQLRGTQGELVRHTNQMTVFIPPSLSGDANWPEVPSEFSQMEERINDAVEHYPQIGEDDTWLTYDVESGTWKDTGVSAAGQEGKQGEPGEQGEKGDTGATPNLTIGTVETLEAGSDATASITGTAEEPVLNLGIPKGADGEGGGDTYMTKENPVGTGSFSMNRQVGSTVGLYSHAEGQGSSAEGYASHAEGWRSTAYARYTHAEGFDTGAWGESSHSEGYSTRAHGNASHAEGDHTNAQRASQHVQGEYNVLDTEGTSTAVRGKYAHIVGNGTSDNARSNAHTLDWNGVPWFQGRPQFGGTAQDDGSQSVMANGDKELVIASSTEGSTKTFTITATDEGVQVPGMTGGTQSDWNVDDETDLAYVKNRPCYEEAISEITWDGNTEGLEMVEISIDGETAQIYKVSDLIIPSENFVNATVTARMFGGDYDETSEISLTSEDISEQNGSIVILDGYICVISDENIGSPGLYFVKATQNIYTTYIGGIIFDDAHSSIVIPLAEKFLPAIAKPAPITEGWVNLIWKPSEFCVTFSAPEEFSISVAIPGWDSTMEYSTDAVNWNKWDGSKVSGSSLHFRGIGNTQITGIKGKDRKWTLEGENITCSGNIELLLDCVTVAAKEHPNMGKYCYEGMFYGCTGLVSAPTLPAAAATLYCYAQMFDGCTSLTSAPELPATTLANFCYRAMFNDCKALVAAPELPATTAAQFCYAEMFSGCESLKTVPELPANITAYACYYKMFYGCNNLMTVPKLSAVTLEHYCYEQMFAGCSKIRLSTSQSDSYTWEYRIPTAGSGTLKTDALDSMFKNTGGTFTGAPEINTTYYLHKDCTIV